MWFCVRSNSRQRLKLWFTPKSVRKMRKVQVPQIMLQTKMSMIIYLPQMKINEEVEDIVSCCHIYVNDNDPLEEEDA